MNMTIVKAIVIFLHLILPTLLLIALYRNKASCSFSKIAFTAVVAGFLLVFWLSGSAWHWFGFIWSNIFCILFFPVAFINFRKSKPISFWPEKRFRAWIVPVLNCFLIIVFIGQSVSVYSSRSYSELAVHLKFPLGEGVYQVIHGGNDISTNYHNAIPAQKFALDIVEVSGFGARASGLMPENLKDYKIYGAKIFSPCSGEVVSLQNSVNDRAPFDVDDNNALGNYVAIYCRGNTVTIPHMLKGSVKVSIGMVVEEGELIGILGNSGRTSEPHLHIHAVQGRVLGENDLIWAAAGVPILFDDKFLLRNDRFAVLK